MGDTLWPQREVARSGASSRHQVEPVGDDAGIDVRVRAIRLLAVVGTVKGRGLRRRREIRSIERAFAIRLAIPREHAPQAGFVLALGVLRRGPKNVCNALIERQGFWKGSC